MANEQSTINSGFLNRLIFYFTYSLRNIRRGGRWIALAIFCIAAGVATIVALRGLGLSIAESLVSTVREDNKGDILVQRETDNAPDFALSLGSQDVEFFAPYELDKFASFAAQNNLQMTQFSSGGAVQIAGQSGGLVATSQFAVTYLIDPETYPVIGEVRVVEPQGVAFADLFTGGTDIVISENMAQSQNLGIGGEVRIARSDEIFIVRGIVGVESEAGINNPFAAFFGFAYLDLATAQQTIDEGIGINRVSFAYPEALTYDEGEIEEDRIRALGFNRRNTYIETAGELLEVREDISTVLGDFIVILGLGALLIGGVGILNTMLVLVRRRTNEIAALKTFGLKGRQIALLFLAEGILLGLIGSVIGCIAGVLLGGFVNQFGEQFIQQSLSWKIYPEALLYGMTLGMATTIIFGLAPILTALQIRPAIVLRPNEGNFATLGIIQTLILVLVITILLGLIVGQIVQPTFGLTSSFNAQDAYLWSVIGVAIALGILGLLTLILWILVWVIGKLPAFGWVDLQLALRNMSTQRTRTATTLLALSAGMFALSSITFVGEGTRQLLNEILSNSFGGNVLAIPIQPAFDSRLVNLTERGLNRALLDVEGVQGRTVISLYDPELVAINGQPIPDIDIDETNILDDAVTAPLAYQNFSIWDSENLNMMDDVFNIVSGRNILPEDRGQRVLIGAADSAAILGIEIGSTITYDINGRNIDFIVIGLYDRGSILGQGGSTVAPESVEGLDNPIFQFYAFEVDQENVPQAVAALSSLVVPPTVALDVRFIDSLVSRFIAQFAAIPTIVGILSLFAAAIIMANTIALSTLERRRQIGILKAIGLKSNRVLRVMLIEATLIGLLSALLGIGLSQVGLWVFTELTGQVIPLPRSAQIVAVILLISAMVIAWVSTFLSANIAVRERVMNVLRYE
ncbi:MAG: FtsX-like permease family protein [Phototrophicaceae bacterium]